MTSWLRISQAVCHLFLVAIMISTLQMRKLRLGLIFETINYSSSFCYIKNVDSISFSRNEWDIDKSALLRFAFATKVEEITNRRVKGLRFQILGIFNLRKKKKNYSTSIGCGSPG